MFNLLLQFTKFFYYTTLALFIFFTNTFNYPIALTDLALNIALTSQLNLL